MMGPGETFGTGPLVKSTLPAIVTVFSVLRDRATAGLLFGSVLACKAEMPASIKARLAPNCCVHCCPDAASYPFAKSSPPMPVSEDL